MAHDHGHDHAPAGHGRAFAIGIALNLTIVALEVGYGLVANSVALIADGAHNLSDVLGLGLAWGAAVLAKRAPTLRQTYGLRRSSILAALANAILLLVATGAVVWEAILRLREPEPVDAKIVIGVAAVGVVVNGATALLFLRGQEHDMNVRAAFLHMAGDALIALGVVASGIVLLFVRLPWLDPVVSIAVSLAIVATTWSLLKKSLALALDGVPEHIEIEKVRELLGRLPGVAAIHDLHIWGMSTTEVALTAHLVIRDASRATALVREATHALHEQHKIEHATLQVELEDAAEACEPCEGEGA